MNKFFVKTVAITLAIVLLGGIIIGAVVVLAS